MRGPGFLTPLTVRLTIWTIVVWSVWFGMLALSIGLPFIQKSLSARAPRPLAAGVASKVAVTQPATPPGAVRPGSAYGYPPSVPGVVAGTLILVAFLGLPPLGIVLLILMILARRAASMGQVRASLASIDAQLRMLMAQRTPPSSPAAGPHG